jgi:hypothetical protein
MSVQVTRLPSRFPVGTRYVIEGRRGQVQARYLEFPDGRQIHLPDERVVRPRPHSRPSRHRKLRR